MHHLLVLQQGEKELTHSFYVGPHSPQPTFQDIMFVRREYYPGWVLQEWVVK
jgi:hypothetical protein